MDLRSAWSLWSQPSSRRDCGCVIDADSVKDDFKLRKEQKVSKEMCVCTWTTSNNHSPLPRSLLVIRTQSTWLRSAWIRRFSLHWRTSTPSNCLSFRDSLSASGELCFGTLYPFLVCSAGHLSSHSCSSLSLAQTMEIASTIARRRSPIFCRNDGAIKCLTGLPCRWQPEDQEVTTIVTLIPWPPPLTLQQPRHIGVWGLVFVIA